MSFYQFHSDLAETTLLKLTSAYSVFVNGGKLVDPILIDRIQDSEGKTVFNNDKRKCINCDEISYLSKDYPIIKDDYKKIFSPETSYQMTSILEGVVQRGTAKKLKDLNLNIAGKTGTTNKNTDTWFIGYTSNLLIGVTLVWIILLHWVDLKLAQKQLCLFLRSL